MVFFILAQAKQVTTSTSHWFETDLSVREENPTGLATVNREAAAAGQVANQERQRIQRSGAIQVGG